MPWCIHMQCSTRLHSFPVGPQYVSTQQKKHTSLSCKHVTITPFETTARAHMCWLYCLVYKQKEIQIFAQKTSLNLFFSKGTFPNIEHMVCVVVHCGSGALAFLSTTKSQWWPKIWWLRIWLDAVTFWPIIFHSAPSGDFCEARSSERGHPQFKFWSIQQKSSENQAVYGQLYLFYWLDLQ